MLKLWQKYSAVNFLLLPLKKLPMWHRGTNLSVKNHPHGCQRGNIFVIYKCSDFWFPLPWEKWFFGICWFSSFPKGLHNPKLTLHSQTTFLETSREVLHLPHFHSLITLANLPTTVTHSNTRQHTTTHGDAHSYNRSRRQWPQRCTPRFELYHMLCHFCMFFFVFFSTHMTFIGWP